MFRCGRGIGHIQMILTIRTTRTFTRCPRDTDNADKYGHLKNVRVETSRIFNNINRLQEVLFLRFLTRTGLHLSGWSCPRQLIGAKGFKHEKMTRTMRTPYGGRGPCPRRCAAWHLPLFRRSQNSKVHVKTSGKQERVAR